MDDGQPLFGKRQAHLLVDGGARQAEGFALGVARGEHHSAHPAQVHGGQAHRAGLAAGVYHAAVQTRAELAAGAADGLQLGMGGRVLAEVNLVDRARQHLSITHQQRAEGPATVFDILPGQGHGLLQVMLIVVHGSMGSGID